LHERTDGFKVHDDMAFNLADAAHEARIGVWSEEVGDGCDDD
jgi:hypothetical protein